MGLNINVFHEPRGVMRVIQFIFAIWAFAETVNYTNEVSLSYCKPQTLYSTLKFGYPFDLDKLHTSTEPCTNKTRFTFYLAGDFSSDAQFFVATGVLSMLYCVGITVVYVAFDALYESNAMMPMTDFMITLVFAVFWLSGSAAWANGLVGCKSMTNLGNVITYSLKPINSSINSVDLCSELDCTLTVGSFSGLNISVTLGFLNFFLWAFDLWFLYKETQWFKNASQTAVSSGLGVTAA